MWQRNQCIYEHEDETGDVEEWIVTYSYHEGKQGVINARPEDCYPDEPAEWEIVEIMGENGKEIYPGDITDKEFDDIVKFAQEQD